MLVPSKHLSPRITLTFVSRCHGAWSRQSRAPGECRGQERDNTRPPGARTTLSTHTSTCLHPRHGDNMCTVDIETNIRARHTGQKK